MIAHFTDMPAPPPIAGPHAGWRSERMPCPIDFQGDPARALAGKRVVVVAAGSVARAIAEHLARAGVGQVDIVDPKRIKHQSLLTHHGVRPDELGEFKAVAAARVCAGLGSGTRVRYHAGYFQDLALAELVGADVVIAAPDGLVAESAIGQACLRLGIPLIHASVHGETLVAQVRVYSNAEAHSPTPGCGFTAAERELMNRQALFSCEGPVAGTPAPQHAGEPTVSFAFLCSMAADLAMTQFLRLVLGLGEPVGDTILEWCGYTHRTVITPLACGGGCHCDHSRYAVAAPPRPLAECSLAELAIAAGSRPDAGPPTFLLDDLAWAERGVCQCGRRQSLARFVRPSEPLAGACGRCGGSLHCAPFFQLRQVSGGRIGDAIDRPLRELGAGPIDWLLVRDDQAGTLFLNPDLQS